MRIHVNITDRKHYVNAEKRTVVCLITARWHNMKYQFVGKSKCSPCDTFDEEKGRRIAESRAKTQMYRCLSRKHKERALQLAESIKYYNDRAEFCSILAEKEKLHVEKLCEE